VVSLIPGASYDPLRVPVVLLDEAGLVNPGHDCLAQIAAKPVATTLLPAAIAWVPRLEGPGRRLTSWHGVTTTMFGNCGVGFAPVKPHHRAALMDLVEGVEEIPGVVLADGLTWEWESFSDFLDALGKVLSGFRVSPQGPEGRGRMKAHRTRHQEAIHRLSSAVLTARSAENSCGQ
jgi:hypothetical protein